MSQNKVYLDYNATGIVRPKVIDGVVEALGIQANASSVHKFGLAAKKLIEKSRNDLADFIKAEPKDIFFTSGGTESNVSVINSYKRKLIISSVEHESVFETTKKFRKNTELIHTVINRKDEIETSLIQLSGRLSKLLPFLKELDPNGEIFYSLKYVETDSESTLLNNSAIRKNTSFNIIKRFSLNE